MNSRPDPSSLHATEALLAWLTDLGVSDLVNEAPRDRFAETQAETEARARARGVAGPQGEAGPAAAPPVSRAPAQTAAPAAGAMSADPLRPTAAFPAFAAGGSEAEALDDARARARNAADLDALREALADFHGCNLRLTAKSLVFGNGASDADLMVVGEAPGREEDEVGSPFVGRSGRLLDRMLAAIGLERDAVRVTNTVPWRPPGNRSPTPAETELCLPFVLRQIELVRPRVLVCLGGPTAKAMTGAEENIMRLCGRWWDIEIGSSGPVATTVMLAPDHLIKYPTQKRLAWRDLLAVKERLDGDRRAD